MSPVTFLVYLIFTGVLNKNYKYNKNSGSVIKVIKDINIELKNGKLKWFVFIRECVAKYRFR